MKLFFIYLKRTHVYIQCNYSNSKLSYIKKNCSIADLSFNISYVDVHKWLVCTASFDSFLASNNEELCTFESRLKNIEIIIFPF